MTDLPGQLIAYEERIRRFFRKEQLGGDTVEDLTQEVLCRLCESAVRFRGDSSRGTWIYGVCRHVLLEHFRREKRILDIEEYPIAVRDETEAVLRDMVIRDLPGHLKLVYDRKYRQAMKIREISRELSIPEGTVKYYLFEIRRRLKSDLG